MDMKKGLMRTETVPIGLFHLVQKLYSFLDIPEGVSFEPDLFSFELALRPTAAHRAQPSELQS